MPILYLILGHMVADFVLQPFKLIRWKFRSRHGIFLHSTIHLLVYLLLFLPYLPNLTVFLSVLAVAGSHFVIDSLKIDTEKKGGRYHLYFFADQAVHLATMLAGGWIMAGQQVREFYGETFKAVYGNPYVLSGLILLFFSTYAVEMYRYQFRRERKNDEPFVPDYAAMLKRAVVFAAVFAAVMCFALYRVAAQT
jgi:hypothetical protein